ncbi:hypothetical protein SKP52_16920 [Sphingopyxis fribergensis]|uniref:Uncharacterized protein n=1 Tax=Sphingopyxis fribergensis TaxID=1515612 RepID=A0A0A7PJI9_9SPHN|nr:hypothetical protein [Sphingopyxis fribergensis]AJA10256.1 hypothetical protein SKP52_16920 [Sphingopyxis fribergensis]
MIQDAPSARSKSGVIPRSTPVAPSIGEQRTAFPILRRSSEGRLLSAARYRNGESFFLGIEKLRFAVPSDLLYQSGIVAQMALSSHLLDVGFDDRWCARNIGLHIGKALAYANATGLNYHSPSLEWLAPVLSPYNVWRNPDLDGSRPPAPELLPDIPPLLRELLDHVRGVTGHPRPRRRKAHG